MRVLILGGNGLLGHKLCQVCCARFETWTSVRRREAAAVLRALCPSLHVVDGVDVLDEDALARCLLGARPDVVVNCVGLTGPARERVDPLLSTQINALLPHRLARHCAALGARLLQISTGCVFSGKEGMRTEVHTPDPIDIHGRSKLLGEVAGPHCLTLRTSFIGRELARPHGLLEWFLARRGGSAPGYTRVIFSGLTTNALAETIADLITRHADLEGLYHVASSPISKYELLALVRDAFDLDVQLEPCASPVCDRSLDDSLFRAATGMEHRAWPEMIAELVRDQTPYGELNKP
jgi:dTDP-4-dehydrorhamnose reductase